MWQVVGYVGLGLKRPFWKLHVKFAKAKLGSLHADLTHPNIEELIFFLNFVQNSTNGIAITVNLKDGQVTSESTGRSSKGVGLGGAVRELD